MKKFLAILMAAVMALSLCSFAAAEEDLTLNIMLPDFYSDSEWQSLEDGNPILQKIYEDTGVKMNITWVANSAYTEMTSLTLADPSNMPDIMVIQGPRDAITINSARAGAFWDLTDYIDQYEYLAQGTDTTYNNCSIDGRIYGIYRARAYARAGIYYRTDYAEKVGITEEPTTVQQFKDLCFALAGYSEDTYCINMCKYVSGTIGLTTVYFGAPYEYGVDENGKIYPAFEAPEFLEGLTFLRELYAAGGIDPDFMTIESGNWNDAERAENPKAFMRLDCIDNGYRYQEWLEQNLGYTDVVVGQISTLENDAGKIQIWPQNTGASGEIVITKAVSADKLPRVLEFLNYLNGEVGQTLINCGIQDSTYWIHSDGYRYTYPEGEETNAATYDTYTHKVLHSLNQIGMNVNGDLTPSTAQTPLRSEYNAFQVDNVKYVIANPCLTLESESYSLMGATLAKELEDAEVQYIANIIDEDGLRAAFDDWYANGGQDILDEYQVAYDARNAQ